MSDTMKVVITGTRAVHDGLGNKLAPTVRDSKTGHVISQPVHTVPSQVGHILCGANMAEMVTEAPASPTEPPAPPAAVEPAPVASPAPPAAPEGGDVGGIEAGIAEAEAEAAPATEAEKADAEAEAGEDVAAELAAAGEV